MNEKMDLSEASKVSMEGVYKYFPGVIANDNVTFYLKTGEVHSLLGENGAGKTTLMKMLAGLYKLDKGVIKIDGQVVEIQTPQDAFFHGIEDYSFLSCIKKRC